MVETFEEPASLRSLDSNPFEIPKRRNPEIFSFVNELDPNYDNNSPQQDKGKELPAVIETEVEAVSQRTTPEEKKPKEESLKVVVLDAAREEEIDHRESIIDNEEMFNFLKDQYSDEKQFIKKNGTE